MKEALDLENNFQAAVDSALGILKVQPKEKPEISHLVDAVVKLDDGTLVFVPDPGEFVVVERNNNGKWFDTRLLKVKRVNEETGDLLLFDTEVDAFAMCNYLTAPERGYLLKLPPGPGWKPSKAVKRVRKRVEEIEPSDSDEDVIPEDPRLNLLGGEEKRKGSKRGRPKGSKNKKKVKVEKKPKRSKGK
jgi:hypothetical protein